MRISQDERYQRISGLFAAVDKIHLHRHLPDIAWTFARHCGQAVASDMQGRTQHQPGMSVDAAAFVPPPIHGLCIDADGDAIQCVAVACDRREVDHQPVIATPTARQQHTVDPHRGMAGDAVQTQFHRLAADRLFQPERGQYRAGDSPARRWRRHAPIAPPQNRAAIAPAARRDRRSPAPPPPRPGPPCHWRTSRPAPIGAETAARRHGSAIPRPDPATGRRYLPRIPVAWEAAWHDWRHAWRRRLPRQTPTRARQAATRHRRCRQGTHACAWQRLIDCTARTPRGIRTAITARLASPAPAPLPSLRAAVRSCARRHEAQCPGIKTCPTASTGSSCAR